LFKFNSFIAVFFLVVLLIAFGSVPLFAEDAVSSASSTGVNSIVGSKNFFWFLLLFLAFCVSNNFMLYLAKKINTRIEEKNSKNINLNFKEK
jgi:hypothetical protein